MSINEFTLKAWAKEAGFSECALCGIEPFEHERKQVEGQPPLRERSQLCFFPQADCPEAKSLAVLLWAYKPAELPKAGQVFVDSYYDASNAAYHAAKALEKRMLDAGCYARANVSYPAKAAAVRAGLGYIGKSSLLITPRFGTRVVIILLATGIGAERHPDTGAQKKGCIGCNRCVNACPSGALSAERMNHPERCLRNYMMEGIVAPEQCRAQMGMTLIGCDICQRVCPLQPETEADSREPFLLQDFLTEEPRAFADAVSRLAERIGRNAARPQRVRAQAAILAGNSKNKAFLPVLSQWADSEFEAVREHARWAIARLCQEQK